MTTKPKVRKYNWRHKAQSDTSPEARSDAMARIRSATQASSGETQPGAELDDIKREGLTGRQLRIARRLASKHGLAATSDYDAVRLLRKKGIDPFRRSNLLELASANASAKTESDETAPVQLPQPVSEAPQTLPGPEMSPAERRDREIGQIQKDIALRRKKKLAALFARLAVFVFLPTFVVGYYFYREATPMYASDSAFSILQADGGGGTIGGLLSGTQYATAQDSVSTQEFLESKDALERLERDMGLFPDLQTGMDRPDPEAASGRQSGRHPQAV